MKRIFNKYVAAIIAGVGVGLRLWVYWRSVQNAPFWYDEAYTWIVAGRPLADMIAATGADVHPPLWYLLVKAAALIRPETIESARWLPCLFSIGSLFVFWSLSRAVGTARPARLWAFLAMSIMPVQLFYAAELRMYSFLEFLVLVQLWSIYRGRWGVYGAATLAGLYTHNYGILYGVVFGAVAFYKYMFRRVPARVAGVTPDTLPVFLAALIVPWVLYLPWVGVLIKQILFVGSGAHWEQPINAGDVLSVMLSASVAGKYPPGTAAVIYIVFMGALLGAVYAAIQKRRLILIAWALGPFMLAVAGSVVMVPMLLFRGLLGSAPGVYILIAEAVTAIKPQARRFVGLTMAGAVAVCFLFFLATVQYGTVKGVPYNAREPLTGLVVHLEDTTYITFSAQGNEGVNHVLLTACPEQIAALGPVVRAAMGLNQTITPEQLPGRYTLVSTIGPLSTRCHEETWARLAAGAKPAALELDRFYIYGVWNVQATR